MPTRFLDDSTPVVQFDAQLEISPFVLFRRMKEGKAPVLIDVRPQPADEDVVLFDDDGSIAIDGARHMQAGGWSRVKALFGGLELYEFSLDPEVVGEETFLVRIDQRTPGT
jgi:hypothetical protein